MPVIFTIVRSCLWPRLRFEFLRRRFLNATTFGPRVCSTISPRTLAPSTCGAPIRLVSPPKTARTSSKTTSDPGSPARDITVIWLSAATEYCLPPLLITANISVSCHAALDEKILTKLMKKTDPAPCLPATNCSQFKGSSAQAGRKAKALFRPQPARVLIVASRKSVNSFIARKARLSGLFDLALTRPRMLGGDLVSGVALLKLGLHDLKRVDLGGSLYGGDFADHSIQGGFIELSLRVRLFRLGLRPVKIAHNLRDCANVARVDFRLVFLRPARPHRALNTGTASQDFQRPLCRIQIGNLPQADSGYLCSRHP